MAVLGQAWYPVWLLPTAGAPKPIWKTMGKGQVQQLTHCHCHCCQAQNPAQTLPVMGRSSPGVSGGDGQVSSASLGPYFVSPGAPSSLGLQPWIRLLCLGLQKTESTGTKATLEVSGETTPLYLPPSPSSPSFAPACVFECFLQDSRLSC